MASHCFEYTQSQLQQAFLTLRSIEKTIVMLREWNQHVTSAADYYSSQQVMQLLTANCTLITAIGEGINRVSRCTPGFLQENFPQTPWKAIIGMRNHIAHGYFELDADILYTAVSEDIPPLLTTIQEAKKLIGEIYNL